YRNDVLRYRNEININGEGSSGSWKRLASHYTLNRTFKDWYNFYGNMVHTLGRDRFIEWTLTSGYGGRSWAGFDTGAYLSDFTGINFIYTLRNSYSKGNINNYDRHFKKASGYDLNPGEQIYYDSFIKKYPAIDFVSNLYAAGSYWYDSRTNSYSYNGDTQPAYEIPAGDYHEFDFGETIVSANEKFKWSQLRIDSPKTKSGGTIEIHSYDPKRIVYTPNLEKLNEIDEFDVTIIPDNWEGRPERYVPGYKFKIKVRNVVRGFEAKIHKPSTTRFSDIDTALSRIGNSKTITRFAYTYFNPTQFTSQQQLVRMRGYYRAQADGDITIKGKVDDWYKLRVNESDNDDTEIATSSSSYSASERVLGVIPNAVRGKWYWIDLDVYNNIGNGFAKVYAESNGIKLYNFTENVIPESLADFDTNRQNWDKYLDDPAYDYKPRGFDLSNRFSEELNKIYKLDNKNNRVNTPFTTTSSLPTVSNNDTNWTNINAIDDSNKRVEYWNQNQASFKWTFEKPVNFNLIKIKNYWKHETFWPDRIQIYAKVNGQEQRIYKGRFGSKSVEDIYIDYNLNIEELRIEFKFAQPESKKSIVIGSVGFYIDNQINKYIGSINQDFNYYGNWKIDRDSKSFINGYALTTRTINDYLEFTKDMKSYVIYGNTSQTPAIVDIYHDDKLVAEN
ncbi:hypothetical protein, partial [Mycoplasma bradburyae]|uniref:hypothetical protein n=1 Tax=Mycoplasma bradburyae TaxID=2963128 RepID=UPI0023401024